MRCAASIAAVLLVGGLPLETLGASSGRAELSARIEIDAPAASPVVTAPGGLAFLAGRIPHFGSGADALDIIFLIDTSDSTDASFPPSTLALSIPGEQESLWAHFLEAVRGPAEPDPRASILGEEVRQAEALLGALDPQSTRVGVVTFAGYSDPALADAWTELPLSSDFEKVRTTLRRILKWGSLGRTNPTAGLNRAIVELLGTSSADSEFRDGTQRTIVRFTDGTGAFPIGLAGSSDAELGIRRIGHATRARIRVDSLVIGEEAARDPQQAQRWAALTGGQVVHVSEPDPHATASLRYAHVESLRVRNTTTGRSAQSLQQSPDGGFACLIRLRSGLNRIEVSARLRDGKRIKRLVFLERAPEGALAALSPRLQAQRNRLLEKHLLALHLRGWKLEADSIQTRQLELRAEAGSKLGLSPPAAAAPEPAPGPRPR